MKFVTVPAGSFYMGSRKQPQKKTKPKEVENKHSTIKDGEDFLGIDNTPIQPSLSKKNKTLFDNIKPDPQADSDELPLHKVTLTHSFQMGVYEVTLGQFKIFLREIGVKKAQQQGLLSKDFIDWNMYGDNVPVTKVSWDDAQLFIKWLNQTKPAEDRGVYRLPTEAEWEYAARAGSQKIYISADTAAQLKEYAWFNENSNSQPHSVGQKKPNQWGLYDMQGNVWEWVEDSYDANYYGRSPKNNPLNSNGEYKALRGGSWNYDSTYCRAAERRYNHTAYRSGACGFRVVRIVSPRT